MPLRLFVMLVIAVSLSGCAVMQSGSPAAAMVVKSDSFSEVESAVVKALKERGYGVVSREGGTVTMERPASSSNELFYGNWNDSKSNERVVAEIILKRQGYYNIKCTNYIVRGAGSGMEDITRRLQARSSELSGALRDVRNSLRRDAR